MTETDSDELPGPLGAQWAQLIRDSGDVPERVRAEVLDVLVQLRPSSEDVDLRMGWPVAPELHCTISHLRALIGLPYEEEDEPVRDALTARDVLAELVALKDGPRDEMFEARKPHAWNRAREVLAGHRGARDAR